VKEIVLAGNKITKDYVILRELTFRKGDTLRSLDSTFRKSKENLLNTSLFHTAEITWLADSDGIKVFILLSERWYIFPVPIFEVVDRNFNEWWKTKDFSRVNYGAYLYWNNFRGRNETVSLAIRLGYTQRFSMYYEIPFINIRHKAGLISPQAIHAIRRWLTGRKTTPWYILNFPTNTYAKSRLIRAVYLPSRPVCFASPGSRLPAHRRNRYGAGCQSRFPRQQPDA
jgi:hypothetical protein